MTDRRSQHALAAALMAAAAACVLTPVADALATALDTNLVTGLLAIAIALYVPAYLVAIAVDRDIGRVVEAGEERRRRLAELERHLDGIPLPFPCDAETFERVVEQELLALPPELHAAIERSGVRVLVEDQRDSEPFVLGVFTRRAIAPGAGLGGGARTDVVSEIVLYRRPIVRAAHIPERLATQVRETLLHEVGHLLGMSEADLDRFSIGNAPRPDAVVVTPRT